MKIKSIKKIEYSGDVYNLRINSENGLNHNYIAEGICVSNCHTTKSQTIQDILEKTIGSAWSRFGVTGTLPAEDGVEILTLQSVLGPMVAKVTTSELQEKGIVSDLKIKILQLNHDNPEFEGYLSNIKKAGNTTEAFNLEKKYVQESDKRNKFIINLIQKLEGNTLILFHNIDFGEKIFNQAQNDLIDKDVFYIDGNTKKERREEIKGIMEITSGNTKNLIASYGTLSTGINIKAINNIIFTDSFKSEVIIRQSIGRGLRLHDEKTRLTVYDIGDCFQPQEKGRTPNFLIKHQNERIKIYKSQGFPYDKIKLNL